MRPTAWTGCCAAVAVVLGVIGLYLDSLAAVAGTMGITAILSGQAVLFFARTSRYADGLRVEREIGRSPVVRGSAVSVVVRAKAPKVPGLEVRLSDLPPHSAVYTPDDAVLHDGACRYMVRFMAPGDAGFRGLLIEAADTFFSITIACSSPRYAGEPITVHPSSGKVGSLGGLSMAVAGSDVRRKEFDRLGVYRGEDTSGFRPFRQGDDISMMDWKLTAKYGTPFIRQRTTQGGDAPLVIVDLPVSGDAESISVLSAASEAIERIVQEFGECSLLVISGGEVIDYYAHQNDPSAVLPLLTPQPADRSRPLFRVLDPVVLIGRIRSAERGTLATSRRLAIILRTALRREERSQFEEEVDRALAMAERRQVVVYSSASGEVGHLNMIASAARRRRQRLVLRVPRSTGGSNFWLSPYPYVETI